MTLPRVMFEIQILENEKDDKQIDFPVLFDENSNMEKDSHIIQSHMRLPCDNKTDTQEIYIIFLRLFIAYMFPVP